MSFDIKIDFKPGEAITGPAKIEQGLNKATDAADRTSEAMGGLATAGAAAGAAVAQGAEHAASALDRAAASARSTTTAVEELATKASKTNLGNAAAVASGAMAEYDRMIAEGTKAQANQAAVLERIRGPMRQYQTELAAIDSLLAKGAITASEYDAELEKLNRRIGAAPTSVHGPVQQKPGGEHGGGEGGGEHGEIGRVGEAIESIAPRFGAAGELLGGLATKGTVATAAIVALGAELVHVSDEYIRLANAAQKVTEKGGDVNETLRTQYDLSLQLHGSVEATLELYDAVRDGTDELNMSQAQQLALTKEIGDAVLAEGKSLEAAEGLMRRLTFAFASGAIGGREIKSIMKEFPDIGAAFVETMGHSRKELIDLANKGQISAEKLIDAFHKMGKEMDEKVGKKAETVGQKWQHLKDDIALSTGDAPAKAVGGLIDGLDALGHTEVSFFRGIMEAMSPGIRAIDEFVAQQEVAKKQAQQQAEAVKLLAGEQDRNAKTAELAGAAIRRGIDFGPFSKELADKAAAARIQMRQVGIDIGDAFEQAHGNATLFGAKLDEISERKDMDRIADAVKRVWDELHGVDDIMEAQHKRWTDLTDKIDLTRKAIERMKGFAIPFLPQTQDQRELERQLRDLQTEQSESQYGKGTIGINTGKAQAKDQLEDYTRALKEGHLTQEAFRKKYDETMTTMNDGRLPEVIKLWEQFSDPIQQRARDIGALNVLFRRGTFDAHQYIVELDKIRAANPYDMFDSTRQKTGVPVGPRRMGGIEVAVSGEEDTEAQYKHLKETQAARAVGHLARPADLDATTLATQRLNEQLAREIDLARQEEAPLLVYQRALEEIQGAVDRFGLSQDHAAILQHKARAEYDAAVEALHALPGPTGAYEATLRKLNDELQRGDISAKQYGDGVDQAKIALLQATGAADEFRGAMQIEWSRMKSDADSFGASVARLVVDDFGKLNDAIVTAANGGEVAWSQMADAMIQDLERILLKMAEVKLIQAGIGLFGDSEAAGAAVTAGSAAGYATGGSYRVGGSGGVDSQLQMFWATPGEQVTVTPPGAYPYPGGRPGGPVQAGGAGSAAAPVIHVHNHFDNDAMAASIVSPSGQTGILNVMRANAPAIRAALGIRG